MASPNRTVLVRLMASMATGDPAALFPFIDEFGNELAGTVRRLLMSLNRPDVLRKNEDVDYLVQSAAFVLFDRSPSWDPAGALPWTWAERAIRAEIVRWLGHPAVEWDDRSHGEAHVGSPVMVTPDLVDLAGDHVELAQLLSALTAVASERGRRESWLALAGASSTPFDPAVFKIRYLPSSNPVDWRDEFDVCDWCGRSFGLAGDRSTEDARRRVSDRRAFAS